MEKVRILLVEDDQRFGELQRDILIHSGFEVRWLQDGLTIVEELQCFNPALIVLDIMLPGMTGFDVCREIRGTFAGRILFLTSSDEDIDHVSCLELGADDFLTKPVAPRVLIARIRMLLRRKESSPSVIEAPSKLTYGKLVLKQKSREACFNGSRIALTGSEFDLLWILAAHSNEVLDRNYLFQALRGIDFDGSDRSIDTKIVSLRKKLGDTEGSPKRIVTIRSKGYLFSSDAWD